MRDIMSEEHHATIRGRRADCARIKATCEQLGGMYITDFLEAVSYLTPGEILKAAGNAGARKLHEFQARRDAGETFSAITRREDGSEADDDDISREEIAIAKQWARMGRTHKETAWKKKK